MLQKIQKAGFIKKKNKKAQLGSQQVNYLEVTLGQEGCSPKKQKVELILKLPAPTDVTALKSFWGMVNFSQNVIKGFSKKAAPLHKLLKKGVK